MSLGIFRNVAGDYRQNAREFGIGITGNSQRNIWSGPAAATAEAALARAAPTDPSASATAAAALTFTSPNDPSRSGASGGGAPLNNTSSMNLMAPARKSPMANALTASGAATLAAFAAPCVATDTTAPSWPKLPLPPASPAMAPADGPLQPTAPGRSQAACFCVCSATFASPCCDAAAPLRRQPPPPLLGASLLLVMVLVPRTAALGAAGAAAPLAAAAGSPAAAAVVNGALSGDTATAASRLKASCANASS